MEMEEKKNQEKLKLNQKLAKILTHKNKPLVGNHLSVNRKGNKRTKRIFRGNLQKFKIAGKIYKLRVKDFRSLKEY